MFRIFTNINSLNREQPLQIGTIIIDNFDNKKTKVNSYKVFYTVIS